jgi:hypothetical protein
MITTRQVFEGTWEELVRQSERLTGKRLRVEILENEQEDVGAARLPFYATATPQERVRAFREWAESHGKDTPLLTDEAISRESIYEDDRD